MHAPSRRPEDDLPTHRIKIAIGDKVDRATVMDGRYPGEEGWYRRAMLHERIRFYRAWKDKNRGLGGPLVAGHKQAIRQFMALIDTAYEVEVSGVLLHTSQNENNVANQCYVGIGGSGWSGSDVQATLLFRGTLLDDGFEDRAPQINHEAVNITHMKWPQERILAGIDALKLGRAA